MTPERFAEVLSELLDELPECFYRQLNGGVLVAEDEKLHSKALDTDLYILGDYQNSVSLGRLIHIYYGSFMRLYGDESELRLTSEMRRVLRHEFRHHVESLAGSRELEIQDKQELLQYLSTHARNSEGVRKK